MVRRRVPFSTTRIALRHVGSSRRRRSGVTACADAQADGGVWRRLSGGRQAVDSAGRHIQRAELSGIFGIPAETAQQGARDGDRLGQRPMAPCPCAASVAPQASPRHTPGVPSALQSRSEPGRARMETHSPSLYAQRLFRHSSETHPECPATVRPVVQAKPSIAQVMRNYLRRRV